MQTQPARYYASEDYLLPADTHETRRLNLQHAVIVEAFENRLSLAPLTLKQGDRVLESAAGTGIWALEFFTQSHQEDVVIECIDISDKQYPKEHPPQIHFSVHSVVDLPMQWTNTFVYVHQRLVVAALNDAAWRAAIKELFRVLEPGGLLELVELEAKFRFGGVGQYSRKLNTFTEAFRQDKGYIGELPGYLPVVLKEAGFVDISCEIRQVPIGLGAGPNGSRGYSSEEWAELMAAMKTPMLRGGGYGIIKSAEEYDEVLQGSIHEWNCSTEVQSTFYTFLARKPF